MSENNFKFNIYLLYFFEFFTPTVADGILMSLCDSKYPQFSRTLISNLVDISNVVIWMVSTRPLISKTSCLYQLFGDRS